MKIIEFFAVVFFPDWLSEDIVPEWITHLNVWETYWQTPRKEQVSVTDANDYEERLKTFRILVGVHFLHVLVGFLEKKERKENSKLWKAL